MVKSMAPVGAIQSVVPMSLNETIGVDARSKLIFVLPQLPDAELTIASELTPFAPSTFVVLIEAPSEK
jgi:hypothetical protein